MKIYLDFCSIQRPLDSKSQVRIAIEAEAIQVLCKAIGVADTTRFISQFTKGYGNYTNEREQLFAHMTLNDIVFEIKQMKGEGKDNEQKRGKSEGNSSSNPKR